MEISLEHSIDAEEYAKEKRTQEIDDKEIHKVANVENVSENECVSLNGSEDSVMESFDTYKIKIEELCASIGLTGYEAEVIQYGLSYGHCVYGLTYPSAPLQKYILRIPNPPLLRDCDPQPPTAETPGPKD